MSTITKERLQRLIRAIDSGNYDEEEIVGWVNSDEILELARIALASLEAKPIGAFHIADQQVGGTTDYIKDGEWPIDDGVIEVYAAPPAPVSVMDEAQSRELFEKNCMANIERNKWHPDLYAHLPAREQWAAWEACRNAMLQGADGNSPDGWVACSERMPDHESKFRVCAYTPTPHEDVRFRFVPASLFKSVCRDATHWQYMLPPAAPQQEVK